jgi:peptidoglycan/xylan/chitin deacetylase (PgdA/CDA1 family)
MWTRLFEALSPPGERARLTILILHRVLPQPDALQPDVFDAGHFDAVCRWIDGWFRVLPLDEAVQRLRSGSLPARAAAITFDDGYADNHDVALPILQRHALTATFFISTGYLDGGRMFNDSVIETLRRAPGPSLDLRSTVLGDLGVHDLGTVQARQHAIGSLLPRLKPQPAALREEFCAQMQRLAGVDRLPDDLMMTSGQVRAMHRAGMGIGGHTVAHPILARLDGAAALAEITRGRETLEDLIGDRVTLFAYPNGRPDSDYTTATVALVRKAGFDAAVTTAAGVARCDSDPHQLPRFTPWDRSRSRFAMRAMANLRRGREATAVA